MGLVLSQQPAADALLDRDPLALLIGMVLDQQISLERAFLSPYDLVQRLGHDLDAAELADFDPDALGAIFATPRALHRFPKAMAKRVQEVCRLVVDRYDGDTAAIWKTAEDGAELLRRVAALPGFGKHKAQIFVALLGKQYDVQPPGWAEAAGPFGQPGSYLSVADIVDAPSLLRVREYKQQMKAAAKASAPAATPAPSRRPTKAPAKSATTARVAKPAPGAATKATGKPAKAAAAGKRTAGKAATAAKTAKAASRTAAATTAMAAKSLKPAAAGTPATRAKAAAPVKVGGAAKVGGAVKAGGAAKRAAPVTVGGAAKRAAAGKAAAPAKATAAGTTASARKAPATAGRAKAAR